MGGNHSGDHNPRTSASSDHCDNSTHEKQPDATQLARKLITGCIQVLRVELAALRKKKRAELKRADLRRDPKRASRALGTFAGRLLSLLQSEVAKVDSTTEVYTAAVTE